MITETRQLFGDYILKHALTHWGVNPADSKQLGGFESFVYEFTRDGRSYIMKLAHDVRRTADYIMGELDFVNYLADHGVTTPPAVASLSGELTHTIPAPDGSNFVACVFQKAPGQHLRKADRSDDLYITWGRLLGKMHHLTRQYTPSNPARRRQHWHQDEELDFARWLPEDDTDIIAAGERILSHLRSLPTPPDAYGLIHEDAHPGNFFLHNGTIWLFDFDDCQYHWFINDLCMPVFYKYMSRNLIDDPNRSSIIRDFWEKLWTGYRVENDLESSWLDQRHWFFKLREIILYVVITKDPSVQNDEWCRWYMTGRRESIIDGRPLIEM
jgi:amicoumacin kinase